jgi:hypothetical protein
MLRLTILARNPGTLQFFVDEGEGYSVKHQFSARYQQGENTLLLPVSSRQCHRIRFDPFVDDGAIVLKKMEIAPMDIRPVRNY